MRNELASERYFDRHIESDLPDCPVAGTHWHDVLVIPAYREDPALLGSLCKLQPGAGRVLVILVLNRPDTEPDATCNEPLREAAGALTQLAGDDTPLFALAASIDLYLHDMDTLGGALHANEGVGLARKTGCDIALDWQRAGAITNDWLYVSDADARLPPDYFRRLDAAPEDAMAAVFPFHHSSAEDAQLDQATALYELRLHHYVLGLDYAGSPYALHTLGSCLAVRMAAYCHVRGFPKRAGAEDFYLLNKLAKIGRVERLGGDCLHLASRHSSRVPFGTGPAVAQICASPQPSAAALFYDPRCFSVLKVLLEALPAAADEAWQPELALTRSGVDAGTANLAANALDTLGMAAALAHCRRQSATTQNFLRHFHQWFDGFRTLKFIHALRAAGMPELTLEALDALQPSLWPGTERDPQALRAALREHWGWRA